MAVGDDAKAAGYPLVPGTGDDGLVRYGARELNRTRDFVAALKNLIPKNKGEYRGSAGISSGYTDPTQGDEGDIYFKIIG
jgi:hypothetical protein